MSDGGKGSAPRSMDVPREDFDASFDRIFGKRERKEYVPPPLPDEAAVGKVYHYAPTLGPFGLPLESFFPRENEPKPRHEWKLDEMEPPCPAD